MGNRDTVGWYPLATPIVAVIMGVRNVSPYIRTAVRSALAQTRRDITVIVVDDGSTDGTAEIVRRESDPRLQVIAIDHAGPAVALNRGIDASRSPFVAFLDGDDLWAPDKLERQLAFMDAHPQVDLSFSLSRLVGEQGEDLGITSRAAEGPVTYEQLLTDNIVANGSSVVVRRSALAAAGPFDITLAGVYDLDLWLRIAQERTDNIRCLPEILTFYRRRRGQITKDWPLMHDCWQRVFEKHLLMNPGRVGPLAAVARSNLYRYLAAVSYETSAFVTGLRLLGRSLRASPRHFLKVRRSYLVGAALLVGLVLPGRLRRLAERTRNRSVPRVEIPRT